MTKRIAILFDIDGTLIISGGAGAKSWRLAFDELYEGALQRAPNRTEFAKLLERRLFYLHTTVAQSQHYRVLDGVDDLLPRLLEEGYLLGIVTGNLEAAAHIKLHRANLNRFFSFGGYGSDSSDRAEVARIALRRAEPTTSSVR
jgi:phosphoglycolate phosphatase